MELLKDMSSRFTTQTYNLFSNNQNHFADELATLLTDKHIPSHLATVPREFWQTPQGRQAMPLMLKIQQNLSLNANLVFEEEEQKIETLRVKAPGVERGSRRR